MKVSDRKLIGIEWKALEMETKRAENDANDIAQWF
jgi:hypothetical protein